MPRSMTGFGTGRTTDGSRAFVVEVRAVNHKFCDVRTRLPRELGSLDGLVQAEVRKQVARGRIDVTVDVDYLPETIAQPRINMPLALGYHRAAQSIAGALGLDEAPSLGMIIGCAGVLESPMSATDAGQVSAALTDGVAAALGSLNSMRDREGAALVAELRRLLAEFEAELAEITREIPVANERRQSRLRERLDKLLGDQTIDPTRLVQEVAILVDRADVAEEVARLASHRAQFDKLLASSQPVGRKLDFLLQEMQREANTIGSKSASARISHMVVDLKSSIERIREQVQNVE